jgi:hypothetical protein
MWIPGRLGCTKPKPCLSPLPEPACLCTLFQSPAVPSISLQLLIFQAFHSKITIVDDKLKILWNLFIFVILDVKLGPMSYFLSHGPQHLYVILHY